MTAAGTGIGWGIIGAGAISAIFAADLSTVPGARLVAVGSRSEERAAELARAVGVQRSYGSYAELVNDPEVDLVYIGADHTEHAAAARLAIEAGRGVLVEKPFGVSAAQTQPVLELAAERGVFCMEAMWTRYLPAVEKMLELVRDGVIGDVRYVHVAFGRIFPPGKSARLVDPRRAGGALLDLGVYAVSFSRFLLGEPTSVHATGSLLSAETGDVDTATHLHLQYDGGATAQLMCSMETITTDIATVHGTAGRIDIGPPFHHPSSLRLTRVGGEPEDIALPFRDHGFQYEIEEAMAGHRQGWVESPRWSHADTLSVSRTMDAARQQIGLVYPFE